MTDELSDGPTADLPLTNLRPGDVVCRDADGNARVIAEPDGSFLVNLRAYCRATPEERASGTWPTPMILVRKDETPATFGELKPPGYWNGHRFVEVRRVSDEEAREWFRERDDWLPVPSELGSE